MARTGSASVAENSAVGTTVTTVTSTPKSGHGASTYALEGTSTLFAVNATTGAITLTASPDYETGSSYTIRVRATDPTDNSYSVKTVTIAIGDVNEAVVAGADSGSATEAGGVANATTGSAATGNVLTNDADPEGATPSVSGIRTGTSPSGGTVGSVASPLAGAYGSLTLASNGTYTYTVNDSNAAVQALNSGGTLTDSFLYTVTDGTNSTTAVLTVTIHGANDAPTLTAGGTASYTENGAAVAAAPALTLADVDSTTLSSATVTISANHSSDDVLGFINSNPTTFGNIVAAFDSTTGVLTLSSAGGSATVAQWQAALQSVTFAVGGDNPATTTRTLSWTVSDGTTTSSAGTSSVSVTGVNDAPTLTAGTTSSPIYTEGASSGVQVFSGTTISAVESGQNIAGLTLTVSGVSNGANEILTIGGNAVVLTNGNSVSIGAQTVTVSVASGTATVTITGADSAANYETLVNGITYKDTATGAGLTVGDRTITLTSVRDSGATTNGGVDTTALSIANTVSVQRVNHEPTLTVTAGTPTFTEGGSAATLFSGTSIGSGSGDDPQSMSSLTLTVSHVTDGAAETVTVGGVAVPLTAGVAVAGDYTVTVSSLGGDVMQVVIAKTSGTMTIAEAQGVVNGLTYANSSDAPTAGARTVTLTQLVDAAGTAGGGDDTATLSAAATVTVAAVNDAPTNIALSGAGSVSTFDSNGAVVGTLSATDLDSASFTYSVVSVSLGGGPVSSSLFGISGSDLTAVSPSGLTAGTYEVTVRVDDGSGGIFDKTISVTVSDALVVTTNSDSGDDASVDSSYAAAVADGGGLSLREAAYLLQNSSGGTIAFAAGLSGQTITLGSQLTFGETTTLDTDAVGTLTIAGSGITLSAAVSVSNGTGDRLTLSTTIDGSGGLTKIGSGTLALSAVNSFSGGVSATGGTVNITRGDSLGSGMVTLNGSTLYNAGGGTAVLTNALTLGAGGGTLHGTNGFILMGDIGGSGDLTIQVVSARLSGTNSYSGDTIVNNATLTITADGNLGGGAVSLVGGHLEVLSSTTIDNAMMVSGISSSILSDADVTVSGVISGDGGLLKSGTGTVTLSAINTFSGSVTVSAGGLTLTSGSAIADTAQLYLSNGATVTLGANETVGALAAFTGSTINLGGSTLTFGGNNVDTAIAATITGTGGLTKIGSGTTTLSGTNTYTGATRVEGGGLELSGGASIADGAQVILSTGASLTLDTAETIGGLSAASGSSVVLGGTLTLGGDNASGAVGAAISGSGGLIKTGSGTLTLSGTNSFTGDIQVATGTLAVSGGAAIADGAAVSVASGATLSLASDETIGSLEGAGTIALGTHTLTAGGNNASTTVSGGVTGSGGLTKVGSGTMTLTGTNTYTGATNVTAGGLALDGGSALADTGTVSLATGATLTLNADESLGGLDAAAGSSVDLRSNTLTLAGNDDGTIAGTIGGSGGGLVKAGSGVLTLTGTNTYTGTTTINGGTLRVDGALDGTSAVVVASGATLAGSGAIFASGSSNTVTVAAGGTLSPGHGTDAATLTINGNLEMNGTLVADLNGATAGSGYDQVVVAGTVTLGANSALTTRGNTAGTYVLVANDAAEAITGTLSGRDEGQAVTVGGKSLTASYVGGDGNDLQLIVAAATSTNPTPPRPRRNRLRPP